MKTESQIREEFVNYFISLKEENAREGAKVGKASEWEFFIANKIDNEEVPANATNWKCPKFKA